MASLIEKIKGWANIVGGQSHRPKYDVGMDIGLLEERKAKVEKILKYRLTDTSLTFTPEQADEIHKYQSSCRDMGHSDTELKNLLESVIDKSGKEVSDERKTQMRSEIDDMIKWRNDARNFVHGKSHDYFLKNDDIRDSFVGMSDKELLNMVDKSARNLEKMPHLTLKQAELVRDSGIWKKWSPKQLATFQAHQSHLAVDLDSFKEAASKILGRTLGYNDLTSKEFRSEIDKINGLNIDSVFSKAYDDIERQQKAEENASLGMKR